MRNLTQQEIAAMWLYHEDYARLGIGAIDFYERLPQWQKNSVDRMLADITKAAPKPKKKMRK